MISDNVKTFFSKNFLLILNFIIVIILYTVLINIFKYAFMTAHDFFYPYFTGIMERLPSQIGSVLLINILPELFNQNPNDFKSVGIGGLIIFPIIYFSIYFMFAKGFFLSVQENFNIFRTKEFLFAVPLTFILLTISFPNDYHYRNCIMINDTVIFSEYFFVYILIFYFYNSFFRIIVYNKSLNKSEYFINIVTAFLIGAWNEIVNINMGLSLFFFLFILLLTGKKELILKNKKRLMIILLMFLIGVSYYYIFRNYSQDYGIVKHLFSNISQIKEFSKHFFDAIFIKNIACFIPVVFLSFLILLKNKEDNNKKIILIYSFSILLAIIITNYLMILCQGLYSDEYYLFERPDVRVFNGNYIEYVILLLLGGCYYQYKNRAKYIFTLFIYLTLIILSVCFLNFYKNIAQINYLKKDILKKTETRCIIYNIMGETTVLPSSFKNIWFFSSEIFINNVLKENSKYKLIDNQYYGEKHYSPYMNYFKRTYGKNLVGIIYKPDDIADKEFERRLLLLNESKILNKNQVINFDYLYQKYKNKNLSFENLHINKEIDLFDITLKAQAYIYLLNDDLIQAENLYKEYLKKYNDKDIDIYLNLIKIYEKQNKINKIENAYIKLLEIENTNMTFYYELLKIYFYNYQDYNKALKLCGKILEVSSENPTFSMYYNKSLILLKLGRNKEAIETINKAREIEKGLSDNSIYNDTDKLKYADIMFPELRES